MRLDACHHHAAVGPMAGIISPSMPVWIVTNTADGNVAYCNMNEGLGKVLRFGANHEEVIERLRWMARTMGPTLASIVEDLGGVELKPLMAQALHMGDEVHNRNAAASGLLLFRKLTVAGLASRRLDAGAVAETLTFIAGNDHFFLNLSMAACKAMLDAAHGVPHSSLITVMARDGVPHSSLITVMARDGVDFGIRLSGLDQWFTAPAAVIDGLFFPGYGPEDAARDLGGSAITETAGLGGFAMAASPAIVQFVGGTRAMPQPTPGACCTSRWGRTAPSRCPRWTSRAPRPASTPGACSTPASCRSSTPALHTATQAWDRLAPGLPMRRWPVSPKPFLPWWPSCQRSRKGSRHGYRRSNATADRGGWQRAGARGCRHQPA
ncbi:DUF1116 domain-containing protein [Cupriavidus pauculus]|uniref:DUF1116 domain-containing protein n=1 Tax=Cupriavidus pauculus TaxID=82633 RepID=UPI001EE3023D|nr:DUF1116 domain-containing protein [Cupriavidus pauculus]GJG95947.1 hypothetical protein CBA19C6_15680 [Cupriavidus pauculus]